MPHILNVTVPIPETHVLITKDEYEELIAYSLDPVWNMSDLKKKLKIASDETIKDRLLFHPRLEKRVKSTRYRTLS
ncbi:phage protein [Staphylococcus aureus M0177]|nr:phage protein [Staphylococcus aureus M0177]EUV50730.1 phage protein [Staphylococcus aureus M0215]EUV65550.1 phage protein [Staphylococcus aureus M0226]EUV70281.1 phage protein [Staphylococcus aureus M0227]EUW48643.1 phage protein [Staphylococcus aureus M0283]